MTGVLGDGSLDRIWCPEHAPNQGKGYTLADFQAMKDDNHQVLHDRQVRLMEQLGPDVYDHVTKRSEHDKRRHAVKRHYRSVSAMLDTIKRITG